MRASPDSFRAVAERAWPGWTVRAYSHEATGDLVVTLSVTRLQLDSYLGLEGPAALMQKLTEGSGVRELVRQVLTHRKRDGLRRYGKKRGGR